ncbi:hypothetical protein [Macrococcus armenti]|uniref:hypothetical protein n=1 Tax=Macrococcus armenti TaxID=2875764 RepID=UPI001CCB3B5C|nr:hypothetical protein [Macrococcus armenti]UBH15667.1 hypothetical protein LAU44_01540 [Macrococcus armenti]UBH18028.1 hypothetical protein LAU39_01545 [Macrococcus armenti]UBH20293.1 hypothetical protein LAU40_01540 [Macrococcus armenti]
MDITTLNVLEKFLKSYPGTFILISHDEYFLKNTTTKIYEIKEGKLLSEIYEDEFSSVNKNELVLLEFKLSKMMMDPDVEFEEIKKLKESIEQIKNKR